MRHWTTTQAPWPGSLFPPDSTTGPDTDLADMTR